MNTPTSAPAAAAAPAFDLSSLDNIQTADWDVTFDGNLIGWKWTFAGPGHPQTIELGNKIAKVQVSRDLSQEQAGANGRKWKAPDVEDEIAERKARNIDMVAGRLLAWTDMKMDGQPLPFTIENARKVLSDKNKTWLLNGALEFLADEKTFMKRSAKP